MATQRSGRSGRGSHTRLDVRLQNQTALSDAIGYAIHYRRSHDAVIRVYDELGNVIETHEHAGDFKEP
jgi:hypothetical protein